MMITDFSYEHGYHDPGPFRRSLGFLADSLCVAIFFGILVLAVIGGISLLRQDRPEPADAPRPEYATGMK